MVKLPVESDYHKEIAKGRDAYQEFELISEKIELFQEEVHKLFAATTTTQDIERHNLWQALQISGKVLEYLRTDINTGRNALKMLEDIKKVGKPTLVERILP